jgi:ureidoacrylate peracid hydrolase
MQIRLNPTSSVLLIIDMQNGYCDENGAMSKRGMNVEPCKAIVPNISRIASLCRMKGIPVIYTKQEHILGDAEFVKKHYRFEPIKGSHLYGRLMGKPIPLKGTWDAEIVKSLQPESVDTVIPKQKFSAFFGTNLEVLLKMKEIDTLILTGVNSNVCIESTARDAYFREYNVIVVKECIAAPKEMEDLHLATIRNVEKYLGWVISMDELLRAIP